MFRLLSCNHHQLMNKSIMKILNLIFILVHSTLQTIYFLLVYFAQAFFNLCHLTYSLLNFVLSFSCKFGNIYFVHFRSFFTTASFLLHLKLLAKIWQEKLLDLELSRAAFVIQEVKNRDSEKYYFHSEMCSFCSFHCQKHINATFFRFKRYTRSVFGCF